MLRVTPIYGSTGHHPSSSSIALPPSCTLIEWGNCKVLINVGHDESMMLHSHGNGNPLSDIPPVDAILLTDSSLQALGGLPLFCRRGPSSASASSSKKSRGDGRGPDSRNEGKDATSTSNDDDGNTNVNSNEDVLSKVAIYATFPTVKMGQMNLYDHHANLSLDGHHPGYSLEAVDALFSPNLDNLHSDSARNDNGNDPASTGGAVGRGSGSGMGIQTLKYAQTIILNDPNTNQPAIAITPHKAGHLIGACYYTLKRLTDETEVVVAPIYHHAKEKHLDSSTLYKFGMACDVFVTTCGGPGGILKELYIPPTTALNNQNKAILNSPSVGRDEGELVEMILSTLRRGGNVLLPVDASGRVLELLYLLNQHWERHRLASAYNLCWVGSMVHNTLEFVRSQLEWMAGPLGNMFDGGHGHPYALKSVQLFHNVNELDSVTHCVTGDEEEEGVGGEGSGMGKEHNLPTCVLATGASLDHGPARDLFLKWCENADNAIILTDSRRCVERGDIIQAKVLDATRKGVSGMGSTSTSSPVKTIKDATTMPSASTKDSTGTASGPDSPHIPKGSETPTMILEEESNTPATTATTSNQIPDESAIDLIGRSIPTLSQIASSSTSAQLLQKWCEAKRRGEEMADVIDVDVMVPKRSPLHGMELKKFLEKEEAHRRRMRREEERRAMLREVELAKGRLRLNNNANDDVMQDATNVNAGTRTGGSKSQQDASGKNATQGSKGATAATKSSSASRPKKRSRFDADLFLKYSKPCHMTFEVREEAVGIGQPDSIAKYGIGESIGRAGEVLEDDYGIAVEHDRFMDIVSGVDPSKFSGGSGRIGDDVSRRGLGFGADGKPVLAGSVGGTTLSSSASGGKGAVGGVDGGKDGLLGGEQGDLNAEDEFALEAADLSEGTGIIRGRNNRPPVKVTTEPRRLEVLAEVVYVPLEARVDARAARQSIRALQPRQVVILGAGEPSTTATATINFTSTNYIMDHHHPSLLSYVVGGRESESIYAPTDGETMELSVGHAAYAVRLIDTMYMSAEEKEKRLAAGLGEEIPNIEPYEAKVGDCSVSLLDSVATGQKVAADGSIVLAPRGRDSKEQNHHRTNKTVMLSHGDVLLTDMRAEVIAQGMKAEYSAHAGYSQLVVNGRIVVRKEQGGQINVEGPLCEDFFRVRSVVCGRYLVL